MSLTLHEAQMLVDAWVRANGGYWPPLSLLARLTEETGEVAREYNHRFASKKKKSSESAVALEDELADVLFILVCMANEQGVDLDAAFERVLDKARIRDTGRFTAGPPPQPK